MTTSKPANLQVAICIFPGVEVLDYQGPVSFLGFLSPNAPVPLPPDQKFSLTFTYIAPSLDPVSPIAGPPVVPTQTYASLLTKLTQGEDVGIDILWVPGGPGAADDTVPPDVVSLVQFLAPRLFEKPNGYVMSVCTGSWILAQAGVLDGHCATTNKAAFKQIKNCTSKDINWVSHARWVVANNQRLWTSSGVTAGMDMAAAFCQYLVGAEITRIVRGTIELSNRCQDQDEFADFHHLDYTPCPCET